MEIILLSIGYFILEHIVGNIVELSAQFYVQNEESLFWSCITWVSSVIYTWTIYVAGGFVFLRIIYLLTCLIYS